MLLCAGCAVTALAPAPRAIAQEAPTVPAATSAPASPAASATLDALNALQSSFPGVTGAVNSVEPRKWKVPPEIKSTTASDIQSIVRDLGGTLPQLVSQAQTAPGAVAPVFAVYRNLDALYDVLLRVTETATLAGSQLEAARLESARADLQTRRSQLGNAILSSATAQDASRLQLQTAAEAARRSTAAPATGPRKIVVTDGPDGTPAKATRKKKPVAPAPQQ